MNLEIEFFIQLYKMSLWTVGLLVSINYWVLFSLDKIKDEMRKAIMCYEKIHYLFIIMKTRAANEYSSLGERGNLGLYSSPF